MILKSNVESGPWVGGWFSQFKMFFMSFFLSFQLAWWITEVGGFYSAEYFRERRE
jgi:hypothetical protein